MTFNGAHLPQPDTLIYNGAPESLRPDQTHLTTNRARQRAGSSPTDTAEPKQRLK